MRTILALTKRHFRIWRYDVGHRELLLRATKEPEAPTRVDVLFVDVRALHLPCDLDELAVGELDDIEVSRQGAGFVRAGAAAWHEDDKEYFDPTFWHRTLPASRR